MAQLYNQLQSRFSVRIALILFISFLVGFLAWLIQAPSSSAASSRLFLSTLATGQASVLAIVFSVTVVGVQLVATRYSSQLISVFTGRELWLTVGLFAGSIGIDLLLLYTVTNSPSRLHTAGVYTSVILACGSVYGLVFFVRTSLAQSTPEGATDAFANEMTPQRYLVETRKAIKKEGTHAHPLRPLFHLIMRTTSENKRVSTEYALETYSDVSMRIFKDFIGNDVFEDEGRDVRNALFEAVATEHLPEIAEHAEQHGERDIVTCATGTLAELSKQSLKTQKYSVSWHFIWGFQEMFSRSSIEDGQYILSISAWTDLREFLEASANQDRPQVVRENLETIETQFKIQVKNAQEVQFMNHHSTRLLASLHETLETLLENHGNEFAEEADQQTNLLEESDGVRALKKWRDTFTRITETSIKTGLTNDESPVAKGNLIEEWQQAVISASESCAKNYAISLGKITIEFGVIIGFANPDRRFWWADALARVKDEGHNDVIEEAFDELLNYEKQDDGPESVFDRELKEDQGTYYNHLTQLRSSPSPTVIEGSEFDKYYPINSHSEYPMIVEKFQNEVNERYQELQEY